MTAAPRPWLASYPPGVPAEISVGPDETLVQMLEAACRTYADRPAFSNFGRTITFRELDDLSRRFAAFLQQDLELARGERVAIMLPNLLQYPVALYGVMRAGLVAVNVNPLYTAPELRHQLTDSGAKALLVIENAGAVVEQALAGTAVEHVILTAIGDLLQFPQRQIVNFAVRHVRRLVPAFSLPAARRFDEVIHHALVLEPVPLSGDDLACLQYTGGTTGVSRGAMLSHGNIVANVRQTNTWFGGFLTRGQEIVITALPLYHVYALTCNCFCYTDIGGLNVLITDPRDLKGFIREMGRWRFSAITGVNTLYQHLANHPDIRSVDFSSLKLTSAGGMAVMEATAKRWAEVTGGKVLEGYGLSEASPVVTSNPPTITAYTGSIGLPYPSTIVVLRDDDGRDAPQGEPGEICVKGPQVMRGYWGSAAASAAAFTSDGYLRTGDIAVMDERGYFRIVDRKKDMIAVSGLKAYPNEIENVVMRHPAVLEAACIGVPDPNTLEAIKVFVVLRPGMTATVDEIRDHCRASLTPFKVPKHVEFRASLPKSNVGKILRRALRDRQPPPPVAAGR
jgi:long-chain acyl-CoA synthetase